MIDFEAKFKEYLSKFIQGRSEDDIEEIAPEQYLKWTNLPADWLSGQTPNEHFEQMDAAKLIEQLGRYILAGMAVPGVLLGSIVDKNMETYPLLISLMKNYEGERSDTLKIAVVRLIEEMELPRPYDYYIEVIAAAEDRSDFTEACVDELKGAGAVYLENVLLAYEQAKNDYVADCFLDILADMPFDDRVFERVLERFLYSEGKKAFYASLLGKLGSERALPYLEEALRQENVNYYDYTAIKNAFEALGGEIEIERDFSGDTDYESLIDMGDKDWQ